MGNPAGMNSYGDRLHFSKRHSRAKFVRNLIKHGWASISPAELIPPPSPGQVIAGDGTLRRRFLTPDMVRSGR